MSVQSLTLPIFWVSCDSCGAPSTHVTDAFFDDLLAVEYAMEVRGYRTDGERHFCADCPVTEVCS